MKKYLPKGFTMIELLIVIAILGILAVAVLSAINPLEQIRRGRDTSSRSDSEQLVNALERFYASRGFFPWQTSEGDTTGLAWTASTAGGAWTDILGDLMNAQELKSGFTARITAGTANPLYLYHNGLSSGNSVYGCFLPQSNSMRIGAAADCALRTSATDFPMTDACGGDCATGTYTSGMTCMLCLP